MVKGLKVLRHKRTEGGYFNEFLIAKTPDDVENRPIPTGATAAAMAPAPVVSGGLAAGSAASLAFPQPAGAYSPTVDFIFNGSSGTGAQWQFHYTQHQHQQHQQILLCPSDHPVELQSVQDCCSSSESNNSDHHIARQEVVVTSSTSMSMATATPASMSAGLGKMKVRHSRGDSRLAAPRHLAASTGHVKSATVSEDTWQRRANRRRERNRAAAARCRKKRQDQLDGLTAEVRELEAERAGLESRVADLAAARSDLLRRLNEHRLTCPEAADGNTVAMTTPSLASLTTVSAAAPVEEILLTPSLLLPPPVEYDPFKLEPL